MYHSNCQQTLGLYRIVKLEICPAPIRLILRHPLKAPSSHRQRVLRAPKPSLARRDLSGTSIS